ncbi:MAG: zinc ribbon domain-containing protein [Bacillota bacterium]
MAYLPILFRIQEIESKLLSLQRTREKVRDNTNLPALTALQKEITAALAGLEAEIKKNHNLQRQYDLELRTCQDRLKAEDGKLYNGSVVSSRGLEQVQQKAAEYRKNIEKLEDQLLVLMEQDEKFLQQRTDLQKRLQACEREVAAAGEEIRQRLAEIACEESGLKQESSELQLQVPPEWLERYRKIAGTHQGVGIARVKSDSCGACHISFSDSLLQKVKRGEDALTYCENCGRIIYY